MTVVPPRGPFDEAPDVTPDVAYAMFLSATRDLAKGPWDLNVIRSARTWDPALLAWVASALMVTHEAGVAAGRLELLEAHPVIAGLHVRVEGLENEVARLTAALQEDRD